MSTSTTKPAPEIVVNLSGDALQGRLSSLDIFRGATIAAMILVNDPGDWGNIYWPLRHSKWSGWTPTDLVFPFFLFIVGVSMVFSFSSRRNRGKSRSDLLMHVLQRGAILFALGVFINGFPDHYNPTTLRIEGVLQRIALCYVISSILFLWAGPRTRAIAIFVCLAGYWIALRYIPVPGLGVPVRDFPLLDPYNNLTAWLDRKLLMGHLYNHINDPEGALSTIPAVASTLFGIFAGEWLRSSRTQMQKVFGLLTCGIISFLAGELWNVWFPINKNLWTSSFVLLTTGLALIGFSLCYWIFDVRRLRIRLSTFFLVFGVNAIASYALSELLSALITTITIHSTHSANTLQGWVYHTLFVPLATPLNASLIFAFVYVFVCWIPMWVLYRKRVFIKV
jgi:predicted acyltransferase